MRRLRVVSWNVGRIYTPSSNNRLADEDVARVARVLDELHPDVVLLQELAHRRQLVTLLEALSDYAGQMADRCRYDRRVAVLARQALDPAFEQHLLEPTGRGVVTATFSVPGARAAAHPVHFDVFDKARRRSQAAALCALTDARAEPLQIIGGDLNVDPELARRLGDPIDQETFGLLSSRFAEAGAQAGPTLFGLFRVDHLFVRGPLLKRMVTRVSPGRRLPLGDHDPVVCDVDLAVDGRAAEP